MKNAAITLPMGSLSLLTASQLCLAATTAVAVPFVASRAEEPGRALLAGVLLGFVWLICVYDARTLRAPNALVYPATGFALAAAFALGRDDGLQAVGGAAACFAIMLVVAVAGRGRMGMGDVKMAALCGAIVGVRAVVPLLLVTFLLGGAIAAIALGARARERSDSIAFTPFLGVAALVVSVMIPTYMTG